MWRDLLARLWSWIDIPDLNDVFDDDMEEV